MFLRVLRDFVVPAGAFRDEVSGAVLQGRETAVRDRRSNRDPARARMLSPPPPVLAGRRRRPLQAHGTEARRVELLGWTRDRIVRVIGANQSELGLNGSKVPTEIEDHRRAVVPVRRSLCLRRRRPVRLRHRRDGRSHAHLRAGVHAAVQRGVGPQRRRWLRARRATFSPTPARRCGRPRCGWSARGWPGLASSTPISRSPRGAGSRCATSRSRAAAPAKAAAAAGGVRIEVTDAQTGRAVPARLGLYDATGRTPLPSDQAILVHRYADETRLFWVAPQLAWPSTNRQAFYVRGSYEAQVPAGSYQLVVTRGPEYRAHKATIEIKAGQTSTVTVPLQRYVDQRARGWYSGDTHLHLMRDVTDDLDVWGQVAAEDVSVGNLLEMGNIVTTHFRQPAWGKAGRFERDGHMIASGQEDPRTDPARPHDSSQPRAAVSPGEGRVLRVSQGVRGVAQPGRRLGLRASRAAVQRPARAGARRAVRPRRLHRGAAGRTARHGGLVSVPEPRIQGQSRRRFGLSVLRAVAAGRRALLRQARSRVRRGRVVRRRSGPGHVS